MERDDSERIKGLLESARAGRGCDDGRRHRRLQHVHDPREGGRALRHAPDAGPSREGAASRRAIVVGGCWSESMKDQLFEKYPFVDLAFGPGNISRLGDFVGAGGDVPARSLLDLRRVRRRPARGARPRASRLGADLDGLQLDVLAHHRAVLCGGAVARARDARRRGRGPLRPDGPRHAAGQTVNSWGGTCLCPSPRLRGLLRRLDGVPASSASVTRARIRGHARRRHRRRPRKPRLGLRARPPAAAVGLDAHPQGDAPHGNLARRPSACAPRYREADDDVGREGEARTSARRRSASAT